MKLTAFWTILLFKSLNSLAAYELENSRKYVGMITETSHSSFWVKQSSTKCFWFICLISQDVWVWMFLLVLKKLLLSVPWRTVYTCGFPVTDYKGESYKEIFEDRRQDGFLAREMGSKFSDMSFFFGFTADLLEEELLTTHVICLFLCLSCL